MIITELKTLLASNPEAMVRFVLPTGEQIPPHAHVTEAARIDKNYIDCGGTFRKDSLCRLQTWVAHDVEHRLTAGKLLGILKKAQSILLSDDLEVDVEYEQGLISQFPVVSGCAREGALELQLSTRHTACLAQDKCCPTEPPSLVTLSLRK